MSAPQDGGILPPNPDTGSIELGTVGWEDVDDYVDIGTDSNDGFTLVRVQLFRGRDLTQPKKSGVAQGHRIWAQIGGGLFGVPPRGTRVMIAIPAGMATAHGAAAIISTIQKSPATQFAKDRAVLDFGPDTHVVIKGKSVSLQQSGSARFIGVGQPRAGGDPGIFIVDADGCGLSVSAGTAQMFAASGSPPDAKTTLQLTASQFGCMQKTALGVSCITIASDVVTVMAMKANQLLAGQTCIASDAISASAALPAATGPLGAVPSTSCFIGL